MKLLVPVALVGLLFVSSISAAADSAAGGKLSAKGATCEYREQALNDAGARVETSIKLLGTEPAAGSDLRRDSVIGVDVEIRIKDFVADTYFLLPLFPTFMNGSMAPGNRPDHPMLRFAESRVHLCAAMPEVFDSRTVRWPLQMSISLNREEGKGMSQSLIHTESLDFSSKEIPVDALARQKNAPSPELQMAVSKVFSFFESQAALYTVCLQRVPEVAAELTTKYRAWEVMNETTIKRVSELQFEQYKLVMDGNIQAASQIFDMARSEGVKQLKTINDGDMRALCSAFIHSIDSGMAGGEQMLKGELELILKGAADK